MVFKLCSMGPQDSTRVSLGHLQKWSNIQASGHPTPIQFTTTPLIYPIYIRVYIYQGFTRLY